MKPAAFAAIRQSIAKKRADKELQARLKRRLREDKAVLDRLA